MVQPKRQILWESFCIDYDTLLRKAEAVESDEEEQLTNMLHIDSDLLDDDIEVVKIESGVLTPLGVFNILDPMNPIRHVELRIGNTNFGITEDISDIIELTPGVEILRILSRYKFVIGIGKMFTFTEVRREIERQLCENITPNYLANIKDEKVKNNIISIVEDYKQYPDWLIYVFPNGRIIATKNTDENFNSQKQILIDAANLSNGILIGPHNA